MLLTSNFHWDLNSFVFTSTMERIWILIFVAFLGKQTEQQQLSVRTNSISPQANEKDEIDLNCIIKTTGRPTQFQWLMADTLITNGPTISNQSNPDNYLLSLIEKKPNVYHYHLTIKQVSRTHHGRWTCRAIEDTGAMERMNIVLMVAYVPDQMYPICGMLDLSVICETQEGNPRVTLEWYVESAEEQLNVKPSTVRTVDGIIHSEVRFSSLRPPNWMKEYVVCETDFGNCSVSKENVYKQTELYMFKEEQGKMVNVYCNVSNILNEGSVVFEWEDTSLEGKMTLHEGNGTLSFRDEGFGYKEEIVVCRYLWGIMDNIAVTLVVNIPIPSPLYSTTEVVTELTRDFLSTEQLSRKSQPASYEPLFQSSTQLSVTSEIEESSISNAGYSEETQTLQTIHNFSTSKVITSSEKNIVSTIETQEKFSSTKTFISQSSIKTDDTDPLINSGTTPSTSELGKTTPSSNEHVTTVLLAPKSTIVIEEIISPSRGTPTEGTTMPRITYKDEIQRASTSMKLEERTVTPQATTKAREVSTRPLARVTEKPTTLEAKPTLPVLPPESKVKPTDDQGWNVSLFLISLIVIFVVLLVAVIVYQKWKEKTGSYSLPSSTSPNVKNSAASSFRPKPEFSY